MVSVWVAGRMRRPEAGLAIVPGRLPPSLVRERAECLLGDGVACGGVFACSLLDDVTGCHIADSPGRSPDAAEV